MQFSRPLKSSAHSLPSPDGAFIATILPSKLTIRTTRSLQTTRVIPLPAALSTSITSFLWSPSSQRILISSSSSESIRVFSAVTQYSATITCPTSETARATYIAFGASDNEVLVFADFGLKLTVFNLASSKSFDIPAPKLYLQGNATRGYGYRPKSHNLALLTRNSGKDIVSIHARDTYSVLRSWNVETVDAQGISWSPDGKWLAVIESASQGHKILFYTADGHLFKTWKGPKPCSHEEKDVDCSAGVKMIEWSQDGRYLVVGDFSQKATLLSAPTFTETMRLEHTSTINPATGLQIWHEQVKSSPTGLVRSYIAATQITCPPTSTPSPSTSSSSTVAASGTASLTLDTSGTLLATRIEALPTTVFVWDLASKLLRTVLIQHSPIAKISWHPFIPELLLLRCEGDECRSLAYVWEPSYEVPKIVNFSTQLPEGKIMGKAVIRWLATPSEEDTAMPALFFSDTQDCILASICEGEEGEVEVPWKEAEKKAVDIYGQIEESPLNLVPAGKGKISARDIMDSEATITTFGAGADEVDDTFQFKKFVGP